MPRLFFFSFILFIALGMAEKVHAQKDSVVFKNGEFLLGEIQKLDRGVLEIETDYSDSDFKIEWNKVLEIYGKNQFLITLKNGEPYIGSFEGTTDSLKIYTYAYGTIMVSLDDIVYLKGVDDGFKDRFYYSIDVGLSVAKANNLTQFTTGSTMGYNARKWTLGGRISSIISDQDGLDETRNTDASITFRYVLHKGWYLFPEMVFLSNTEQNLDLRTITKLGAGYYFLRTNKAYFTVNFGASNTDERFSGETPDRNSWESFVGSYLNLFDIGDLSFSLNATAYPSLTEEDRFRLDLNSNLKYDLPLDFYIKLGGTYNFDNQPAEGGSKNNYTFTTGIGWEY